MLLLLIWPMYPCAAHPILSYCPVSFVWCVAQETALDAEAVKRRAKEAVSYLLTESDGVAYQHLWWPLRSNSNVLKEYKKLPSLTDGTMGECEPFFFYDLMSTTEAEFLSAYGDKQEVKNLGEAHSNDLYVRKEWGFNSILVIGDRDSSKDDVPTKLQMARKSDELKSLAAKIRAKFRSVADKTVDFCLLLGMTG